LRGQKLARLLAHAELGKVVKQPKDVDEPYDEHDHHNAVQDPLDLTLHGDEAIDQPEQYAYNADSEDDSEKWHFLYSNPCPLFLSNKSIAELNCSR
jgi:hypothetical protein